MKKLFFMLLLTSGAFAQQQVFNVQQYCIDEKPFKKGQCDVSGNEYSFVFLDAQKKDVTLFMSDQKMKYKIVESNVSAADPQYTVYTLQDEKGQIEMQLNRQKTKMEFHYPNNKIYLTVGKSTKL